MRNFGEMLALVHSELSEALEAHRKGLMSDKLPNTGGVEEELADAIIRIIDIGVNGGYDVGRALAEKVIYNRTRKDHTREARLAEGGKKY